MTRPKTERAGYVLVTLLLLAASCFFFSSCKKAKPKPEASTIIYADTNRVRLEHRAQDSGSALIIIRNHSDSTKTPYEHAVKTFDSIRVDLP